MRVVVAIDDFPVEPGSFSQHAPPARVRSICCVKVSQGKVGVKLDCFLNDILNSTVQGHQRVTRGNFNLPFRYDNIIGRYWGCQTKYLEGINNEE